MDSGSKKPEEARVLALVREALRLKVAERAAMLDAACAGDAVLRARVEEMVRQQEMRTITPSVGAAPSAGAMSAEAGRVQGRKFGRYTILEVLGEGGMGTVYLAEQDSPRRQVALKVIRAGLLTRGMLRRFEAESAVLGRLHHPGIAQIYEAGTAVVEGMETPFLAMELVRGVPLTEYADGHALGIRQRLSLMAMVCDAVEHAHTKGVIHRDLKPGNVLVEEEGIKATRHQGIEGETGTETSGEVFRPKILDFGIARLTDTDVQRATMQTEVGQLVGTIPYMSPEQVSGDPAGLDTRSDVYTLGVILYEVLCGKLPHDVSKKTIPEAVRIIGEGGEPATAISSVDKRLRGEVQTIVEKAIEKDKRRRYQSARELADDIRRFLRDEPIAARPASATYKFGKFAKRNKGLVAGLAATMVVLVIGVAGVAWQAARATAGWTRAEENLKTATEAKKRAEEEAANAKGVSGFLTTMLTAVDPETAVGREITARELLDAAAATLDHTRPDTPLVEVTVRGAISQSYRGLGQPEKSEVQLRAAMETAKKEFGADASVMLEVKRNLAIVLADEGKFEEAETLARENEAQALRVYGDGHELTAQTRAELGRVLLERGHLEDGRKLMEGAIPVMVLKLGAEHKDTLSVQNNLATAYKALGMLVESEKIQRAVLLVHEKTLPPDHPQVLSAKNNLATTLQRLGRNADAVEMFKQTLEGRIRVLGEDHVSTATTRLNVAVCLTADGKAAEAEPLARRSQTLMEAKLGPDHPKTLIASGAVAYILEETGHVDEAETWYRRVIESRKRSAKGSADPEVWAGINNLAMLLMNAGKPAEAEPQFREMLDLCEQSLPPDHYMAAVFRNNYGECLTKLAKYADAERELLRSQAVVAKKFGEDHPRTKKSRGRLVALYEAWGKPDEATKWRTK